MFFKFLLNNFAMLKLVVLGLLILIAVMELVWFFHKDPAPRQIELGAWTQGLFDPSTQTLHPEKLLELEKLVDKKFSIAHYYIGWEALTNSDLVKQFSLLRFFGWEPMLNVNPYYFAECPSSNLPLYRAIAQGLCDNFLHQAGKNLKQINQPFFLLFAWEMNNPQNDWSISKSGSSAADFIAAWRHIHDIFSQEGAGNIIWVFCPNVPDDPNNPYDIIYPGEKYVDWIGMDGYNWGTTQSWSQWNSFSGIFGKSYKILTALAPNKPVMIAEVNSTDQGGDKAVWYKEAFTKQIPDDFPKIMAVVIYNEDRTKQENVNWKVDTTPASLGAFISSIHSKFY